MTPIELHDLGTYSNIEAVWAAYPNGGIEGDYVTINGTRYVWNKYDRMWLNANLINETITHQLEVIEGDLKIQNDLTVANNVTVKGTLYAHMVKQSNMGLFESRDALVAAYPNPDVGDWALVGTTITSSSPADLYVCETAGTWPSTTTQTASLDSFDLTGYYTKSAGDALEERVDAIDEGLTQSISLSVNGRYFSSSGAQKNDAGDNYMATAKTVIATGCNRVRVKARATTTMSAIWFGSDIYTTVSYVVGTGDSLVEYDVEIPEGASYVAACDRDTSSGHSHSGFECVCYKSDSLPVIDERLGDVEERIDDLENAQDVGAAMNPINIELTEVGYYGSSGGPNESTSGRHSELVSIKGYTRCRYLGNISGRVLVFFDANGDRLTSLDESISGTESATVNLAAKTSGGAVYMSFNCYNNAADFSTYWCKVDVPSALADEVETLSGKLDALPAFEEVQLVNSGQYVDSSGSLVTGVNKKYKTTGNVRIASCYDKVRVSTHSSSAMSALKFSDGTKYVISSSLSQTTRTYDVAVPEGATSFIASTDCKMPFRCIMYDSSRYTPKSINVLILGDSITDTLTSGSQEGITIDSNNKSTAYYERSPQKWPSILNRELFVNELRNYAKQGAHWCDFSGATFRQQLSEQVTIAIADKTNSSLFGTETFLPDIIIIACGTNDASAIGSGETVGDALTTMQKLASELDMSVVTDAMRKHITALKTEWPNADVYVSLPLQRGSKMDKVLAVREQMIKICAEEVRSVSPVVNGLNCKLIDATYESGITTSNLDTATKDGLHPTTYGQCMLGEAIVKCIKRNELF